MDEMTMRRFLSSYCGTKEQCKECVLSDIEGKACVDSDFFSDTIPKERIECLFHSFFNRLYTTEKENTEAKHDGGKPRLSLVPPALIEAVGIIRTYGTNKYGSPDNWRKVEEYRYRDALMRHLVAYLRNPDGVDEESGYPHLWHVACNVGFLCELMSDRQNKKEL